MRTIIINKKLYFSIFVVFILILFSGCSSKYQTNKLPEEKTVHIPKKIDSKKYYLNKDLKEDFEKYIIKEFNNGINKKKLKNNKKVNISKDLWNRGYEKDKKRY